MTQSPNTALPLAPAGTDAAQRSRGAALAALLLGLFVIYGVGFAYPSHIHNAAHDARHAFAFPCH
jgi:cobalt transporter subunit CbtB